MEGWGWGSGRLRAVGLAVVVVLVGAGVARCGDTQRTARDHETQAPAPLTTGSAAAYAAPWDQRPTVDLRFSVDDALTTVTGTERVELHPDVRVCELVVRLWPNAPSVALSGTALVLGAARVAVGRGGLANVTPRLERAGAAAGTEGTLATLPLPSCVDPGGTARAVLGFTVRLGRDAAERVGTDGGSRLAWWGTAYPLLAYERGRGWMRDPAVVLDGESAGSEDYRLTLAVEAPSRDEVQGTGTPTGSTVVAGGRTVHRFSADAVRDVAVVVGDLAVASRVVPAGQGSQVRVHAAVPRRGSRATPARWLGATSTAVGAITSYVGPFPYPDLWVTVVPDFPTGVEFPGAIMYADEDPAAATGLVEHETAHMWFYGLVGNDQGRDPWLDEGMASFIETLVTPGGTRESDPPLPPEAKGRLGAPMTYWQQVPQDTERVYSRGVYWQGAGVLLRARAEVGPARFDAALRAYVAAAAHRIATPEDLRRAFEHLPAAANELAAAGAFDGGAA